MIEDLEMVGRLGLAACGGILLGFDRELRGMSAGIRTHGLVALSSAAITISALMLHESFRATSNGDAIDPLRVIQGLAQAIGFIAAGAIVFTRGHIHNLTSAANIWLAASLGIIVGAGQYLLFLATISIGFTLITVVRLAERLLPGSIKHRQKKNSQSDQEPPQS